MSDKIDKLFYSFIFEGETRKSSYQVRLWAEELRTADNLNIPVPVIELRNGIFLESNFYRHRFLNEFFHTDPIEIDLFLKFHLKEYAGNPEDFYKNVDLLFSPNNKSYLLNRYLINIITSFT